MKDLSVYVLSHALGKLPCAEQYFRENSGSPYVVQVPTLLQAVKDKEPWNHSREDGQHIRLTFIAKQTVQNAGGCRWFDWVLKDAEEVKG